MAGVYHAHLSFSKQLSEESIFSACLDAVNDAKSVLREIDELMVGVFGFPMDPVISYSEGFLTISFPTNTNKNVKNDFVSWTNADIFSTRKLPPRVKSGVLCIEKDVEEAGVELLVAPSVFCMLGVAKLRSLLVGMAVEPTIENSFEIHLPGLVGLRAVMGARSGRPPCKKHAVTVGTVGAGMHGADPSTTATLLIGAIAQDNTNPQTPVAVQLWDTDTATHLECNLDDITGECLAFAIETLLTLCALDAWVTPIIMKKGRPAYTLHCLCKEEQEELAMETIFRHTTTLGIRIHRSVARAKLWRSMEQVKTPFSETSRKGMVGVKVSKFRSGEIVATKAEYDHCREISLELGIPVVEVAASAIAELQKIHE